MKTSYPQYVKLLEERLTPKRFRHSLNVMERAVELAKIHGADPQKAELAGLIHDIEKNSPPKILLQSLQKSGILLSDADWVSPQLWHAPCGYLYARDRLGIADGDVLNAIRYHTTGRAGMSLLEKVVYLADLTSADRDFSDVKEVRRLADRDLDAALFYSLQFIIGDLVRQGKPLQPDSLACYNEIALARAKAEEQRIMKGGSCYGK